MDIDAAVISEQIAHQNESLVEHRNEGVRTLAPCIPIGDLLQNVGLLREFVVANLDIHGEIRAYVERWVDVDELDPSLSLDLLAQWPILETGEDELVVAPDQLVGPSLDLTSTRVHREEVHL